ncbi:hypothetical protein ERJ75_001109500 [Trypanosoma vivax]|nr:hypothetical protein ERJ75_001109500 [Trypanosoma vivax]
MYVRWNVTFGALQKRAENVTATAHKVLDNRQLCVNETEAVSVANDTISKVAHVLSNTSRALNVSRGFMDGTERDFFNAFEAIKDNPDKYVYGHGNLNDKASSAFAHKSNTLKVATPSWLLHGFISHSTQTEMCGGGLTKRTRQLGT